MLRLRKFLRSTTVRFALITIALFGFLISAILGLVYVATVGVIDRQMDETIRAEIVGLTEQYRQRGLPGLIRVIEERSRGERTGPYSVYLLTDSVYRPMAGNLSAWPASADPRGEGWVEFPILSSENAGGKQVRTARAQLFKLPGGQHLLVGRENTERARFNRLITEALIGALVLGILVVAAGGYLVSRMLSARLETINRGSRAILAGDLGERMPLNGSGDAFDHLAENLNLMLDRIARLMTGMRGVANDIAHDLRTPINRMRSRLEITLLGNPDAAESREALAATIKETDEILATFNALLGISLVESGALKAEFKEVDLSGVAQDTVELYEPLAQERGLDLRSAIAPGLHLRGNRHLLSQALANLLDNAVKYTPSGGTLRLEAMATEEGSRIIVADSGPGIPAEERVRVLERFVRLEDSRGAPGSGLGLSLVAAVAALHDARLDLEDNAPGLRVILSFPAES